MSWLESLMHPDFGCPLDCHFVAAGILPAVEGGILPPGPALEISSMVARPAALPRSRRPALRQPKFLPLRRRAVAVCELALFSLHSRGNLDWAEQPAHI